MSTEAAIFLLERAQCIFPTSSEPPCQADIHASAFGNELLLTRHERTARASLLALGGTGRIALMLAQHGTALLYQPQRHWLSCVAWAGIQAGSQLMRTAIRVTGPRE